MQKDVCRNRAPIGEVTEALDVCAHWRGALVMRAV
jgi:hypothetical protein